MARKTRNRWILLVVMAMVMAAAGLVYAHWQSSLYVDTQVNTGAVAMGWYDVFTNDDGMDNDDGEPAASPAYDGWGEGSSADPAGPEVNPDRYDKDVAACWGDGGGEGLWFQVENGYPSYYCAMLALVRNEGSVPVRATDIVVMMGGEYCFFPGIDYDMYWEAGDEGTYPYQWLDYYPDNDGLSEGDEYGNPWQFNAGDDIPIWGDENGQFVDYDGNEVFDNEDVYQECGFDERDDIEFMPGAYEGNFAIGSDFGEGFVAELTGDIAMGIRCGTQIDPGEEGFQTAGWIHVEQEARQNYNYNWRLTQNFVNWNEFEYFQCNEGVVAADADGNPIGIVDYGAPDGYVPFP